MNTFKWKIHTLLVFWCISCSTGTGKRKSRPNVWCEKAPGLSDGQRKVCHRVPGLQTAIKKGIEKGLSECEREFKWSRWNCTLLGEKNLLQRAPDGTKEAAFTTAMLSAAIAFNIAKACTAKDVTECSCEGVKRPFRGQPWKWKGCNVNIRFGSYAAERFMMSGRSNDTKLKMMSRHNVRAGLEVLKENRVIRCTVGNTGNVKSCHLTLPPLEKISRILKAKYNGANEVFPSLRENKKSLYLLNRARFRNRQSGNRPKKSALVFLVKSQYCYRQDEYRIPGTQERLCRRNTNKEDDCIFLCCGRGYSRNVSHKKRFCNCKKGPSAPCSCKLCTDVVIENKCL
ncbi:Wnt7p [Porites harrisoni]